MSETILVGAPERELPALSSVVIGAGFKVREASEYAALEAVLLSEGVAFCLLDSSLGLDIIRDCTKLLWKQSPEAGALVRCENVEKSHQFEPLSFDGVDVFIGAGALLELEHFFAAAGGSLKKAEEFHILYVEDLDSPREIITMYLQELGFPRVTGFRNGREALVALQRDPSLFDCILTDYKMPQLNGVQFTREIRTTEGLHDIPIIMLTAVGTEGTLRESIRAGISGFLVKPPRKPDLLRELHRARRIACGRAQVRLVPTSHYETFEKTLEKSKGQS